MPYGYVFQVPHSICFDAALAPTRIEATDPETDGLRATKGILFGATLAVPFWGLLAFFLFW